MKVWIVNPYACLPGEPWRDIRSLILAEQLAAAGHEAELWASNFDHRSKIYRAEPWTELRPSERLTVRAVPATPYRKNISLARIRSERNFGRNLAARARGMQAPDVIVLIDPALFFSAPIVSFAAARDIPIVVDIIDLWPEVFHSALPRVLAPLAKAVFWPLERRRRNLLKAASAVVAVTRQYLEVALRATSAKPMDVVYLGLDVAAFRRAMQEWSSASAALPAKTDGERWFIYAGTLGQLYDIHALIDAAAAIERDGAAVRILIAGDGPMRPFVESSIRERGLRRTHYLGKLAPETLSGVYARCDAAFACYKAATTVAMPAKTFDCLAAGLPIIHSLSGEFDATVRNEDAGLKYQPQDARSLAHAVLSMASDPERLRRMRESASKLAERYDIGVQYPRFVRLLEEVVAHAA